MQSEQAPTSFPTAEQLSDRRYWEQLLPDMSISDQPFKAQQRDYRLSEAQADHMLRQIRKEGYFRIEPVIPLSDTATVSAAIERLDTARVLPIFVSMFDGFWQLLYGLRNTFSKILGDGYLLTPDFWAWHISPDENRRGWSMHRDADLGGDPAQRIRQDGRPRLCTIWLALSDATPDNSCIYVLPFPHDPGFQSFLRRESLQEIQRHAAQTNPTDVRALPVQAGGILGWSPHILHWGSNSSEWGDSARISVGIYYQAKDIPMIGRPFDAAGRRYIDTSDVNFQLSLDDRLRIIANALSIYINSGHMKHEPNFSPAITEFCQRWTR